jgi:hypothetical protein
LQIRAETEAYPDFHRPELDQLSLRRRTRHTDDKDDAAIAAARTDAQSGYRGAVMKIIEMQFCFPLFYDSR